MGRKIGDLTLKELREYKPQLKNKPQDFDEFWARQKEKISLIEPVIHVSPRSYPAPSIEVIDLILESWDGTQLNGLFVKPAGVKECPVIVCFHGYTGSCGLPSDYLKWTALGVAVYAFDVRGQGTSPDYAKYWNGSRIPGWMLHGILDPETYYYTNVYRDILTQLGWVKSEGALVIPTTLGLMGSSQGGGLALVAAGLDGNVDYVISDWPYLTHFDRALDVALQGPYMEIVDYFKWNDPQYETVDEVKHTLGYIDSLHFCDHINCPVLMAVGLEDAVTPPSTVYAAYHHLNSTEKEIEVYPQFTHEMNPFHDEKKLAFIWKQLSKGGGRG